MKNEGFVAEGVEEVGGEATSVEVAEEVEGAANIDPGLRLHHNFQQTLENKSVEIWAYKQYKTSRDILEAATRPVSNMLYVVLQTIRCAAKALCIM